MAKLIDDPKVAELITKETDKAVKANSKETLSTVKSEFDSAIEQAKAAGTKDVAKLLKTLKDSVVGALKA